MALYHASQWARRCEARDRSNRRRGDARAWTQRHQREEPARQHHRCPHGEVGAAVRVDRQFPLARAQPRQRLGARPPHGVQVEVGEDREAVVIRPRADRQAGRMRRTGSRQWRVPARGSAGCGVPSADRQAPSFASLASAFLADELHVSLRAAILLYPRRRRTRAEQRASQPDQRRALLDSDREVVAHAHRKLRPATIVAQWNRLAQPVA